MLLDSFYLEKVYESVKFVIHLSKEGVVSCKHSTQDVCTVNKVRKYHSSMCKMVVSGYVGTKMLKFPLPVMNMPVRVLGSVRILAHARTSIGICI